MVIYPQVYQLKLKCAQKQVFPSPYSEGTKRDAISNCMSRTNQTLCAYQILSVGWTFRENNFLLAICLRTRRYEWNERENTRILRMQATTPSSEAAWTETNKTCLWEKRAAHAKAARAKASTSPWSAKPTSWANSLGKLGSTEATQSSTVVRCQ